MSDKSAFLMCCYWVFHLFLTGFPTVFKLESIEKTLLLFKYTSCTCTVVLGSYVGRACKERGHTIRKKRKEKNNKYLKKCEDQGACFSPLSF